MLAEDFSLPAICGILSSMRTKFDRVLLGAYLACFASFGGCSAKRAAADEVPLLAASAPVPDLSGVDQSGRVQKLKDHVGKAILVYFYPKDGTPGCTKEACAFRDVWDRFQQKKVYLVGVSHDERDSHDRFAREQRIPFPLIADTDASWAKSFGVPSREGRYARVSFLFDRSGHLARVYPAVDPGVHADAVLRDIDALP